MTTIPNRICYVYKFIHIPTYNWYVGSRTAKNCHPDDGYQSSSKFILADIMGNPQDWKKEIIATGTVDEMRNLEADILETTDAANDTRSFNKHNASRKFRYDKTGIKESDYTRQKKSKAHTGVKRPEHSAKLKGRKHSAERISTRAEKLKGQIRTEEQRERMKQAQAHTLRKGIPRPQYVIDKIKATKALKKLANDK